MLQHIPDSRSLSQNFVEPAPRTNLGAQVGSLTRQSFPRLVDFAVLHRVVEGNGNLVGNLLHEIRIRFRETMRMAVQQVQYAKRALPSYKRQETAGLQTLLIVQLQGTHV